MGTFIIVTKERLLMPDGHSETLSFEAMNDMRNGADSKEEKYE